MNKIDKVFRELEQLYEFQRELSKFRLKKREQQRESAKKVERQEDKTLHLPKAPIKLSCP